MFSSPNTTRIIQKMKGKIAGYVASIGKKRHEYLGQICKNGRIILKLILRYRITWHSLDLSGSGYEQVNTVRNFRVP